MSYDIYCLGLSSPLLPDGYGSFHWRVMALQPWACSAFLEMPFPSAREAKPLLRTGFLSCPFLRTEEHFFHWRGSSPPESLYLKRCSLHLPVKLRSWGHFQPTFFFFFWETFLHYSPVRSPLVYYSMVICAVLHHLYSSFNCTGLSIIWTSLHPCIAICIPNFCTFNNIYIFDFLLS